MGKYGNINSQQNGGKPEIGVPPVIIHLDGIVPYKPSVLGYPHDYGHPRNGGEWKTHRIPWGRSHA